MLHLIICYICYVTDVTSYRYEMFYSFIIINKSDVQISHFDLVLEDFRFYMYSSFCYFSRHSLELEEILLGYSLILDSPYLKFS